MAWQEVGEWADSNAGDTRAVNTIGVSAAIEAIKRRQAVRVYAETPALKLLGLEDKFDARLEWMFESEIEIDGALPPGYAIARGILVQLPTNE